MPPTKCTAVVVGAARTPIGSFGGALAPLSAPVLGALAIRGAMRAHRNVARQVQEVYMGCVLSAGIGQSPARQAALKAGLPNSTEATTVNKVCASGMKAIMLASQSIALGTHHTMVAGGMESMSNTPYYVPRRLRVGTQPLLDGMVHDGLWDPYSSIHMGSVADRCAAKLSISRTEMDDYAASSYRRTAASWAAGRFRQELVSVPRIAPSGPVVHDYDDAEDSKLVREDEEFSRVDYNRIPSLRPAFDAAQGRVTAANASKLSDGAAALLLMSRERAAEDNLQPLAEIISFADAAADPLDFPTAPSLAIPLALARARLKPADIALWEINEAFAAVAIANMRLLDIDHQKLNVSGGAVAMGHPIGASGARIVVTLIHLLKPGEYGCASICNGGGAASAIIVKRL